MEAQALARTLEDFLAESRHAVVREAGAVIFDLESSRYSLSADRGKCVLHLWSAERNTVRRVLDAEVRSEVVRLRVQRFGQVRPVVLEICRSRDPRTPSALRGARAAYQQLLERLIPREFAGFRLARLSSAADLERSFGPVYARGLLARGNSAFALLGVNSQETQASIDASLTFGILWLELCRERARSACVEGLILLVPAGASEVARERMAHLNRGAAKWRLFELDERAETLAEIDSADRGNVATRLVHCPDLAGARRRFADSIEQIQRLCPEAETVVLSPGEISFRLHGLEFARARAAPQAGSFRPDEEIVFGVGAEETALGEETWQQFAGWVARLREARQPRPNRAEVLWRLCPERWLESMVIGDVHAVDPRLDGKFVYSQVPAFSASDRGMIDVLASTREGGLAVLELKADEDIHLPLQGLDYWARVRWHQQRGEFERFGYFAGSQLSPEPPLLLLVAPTLHIHPTTDTLLRYLSPEIDCELLAIDEHWRDQVKVIFRKRRCHSERSDESLPA